MGNHVLKLGPDRPRLTWRDLARNIVCLIGNIGKRATTRNPVSWGSLPNRDSSSKSFLFVESAQAAFAPNLQCVSGSVSTVLIILEPVWNSGVTVAADGVRNEGGEEHSSSPLDRSRNRAAADNWWNHRAYST